MQCVSQTIKACADTARVGAARQGPFSHIILKILKLRVVKTIVNVCKREFYEIVRLATVNKNAAKTRHKTSQKPMMADFVGQLDGRVKIVWVSLKFKLITYTTTYYLLWCTQITDKSIN